MATDPTTVWEVLNSEFMMSLTGALAGAGAGAYAAQRIVERAKLREELLKELRNTNAAATLAYGMSNSFLGVKKQQVKPLYDEFNKSKAAFLDFKKNHNPGVSGLFEFKADLEFLTPINVPINPLQNLIFEKISVVGRPLGLIGMLAQTVHHLDTWMERRNTLIQEIKAKRPSHEELSIIYYGLKTDRGTDDIYPSSLRGIYTYTDDCIYFSKLLGDDLAKHAAGLKQKLKKQFRGTEPFSATCDFSIAEKDGLMPPAEEYKGWESGYQTKPNPEKRGWRFWRKKSG
jgi:hypothetical protein